MHFRRKLGTTTSSVTALAALIASLLTTLGAEPPVTLTNLWVADIRSDSDATPALAQNGTIYLATFSGKLFAVDPEGAIKWVFETRSVGRSNIEIKSGPALAPEGTIYFGCRDKRVYAVDPNGRLKWSYETGGWVDSSPALAADGTVYIGSWDHSLYAFTPAGAKKWQFATRGEIDASPSVTKEGTICIGSHDGKFYALKPDGTKAWDYTAGAPITSSAAINADGTLYFTSVNGFFHAVNPDGSARWKLKTGGITQSSPVLGQDGTIYVGVNKTFWAISPEGRKLWEQPATTDAYQEPIYTTPCAMADGSVMLASGYGLLAAYSTKPENRRILRMFYLGGYGSQCPSVGPDGTIYVSVGVQGVGRQLMALSNNVALAKSPWPKFRGRSFTGRAE